MKKYKKVPIKGRAEINFYPVYMDSLYYGHEPMEIIGIRENQVEIAGDFSGGTHNVYQKDWVDIDKVFAIQSVCEEQLKPNGCQRHNLHCCGGGEVLKTHVHYWENLID